MFAPLNLIGQGWPQLGDLTLAFVLSALVGMEREARHKSAGLRTYTLVGVSASLFMLISKYGFTDVLARDLVIVDPSRVAAQIVSGIGFIGGGVIFMRRDIVRGLTTAASVWLTAALGMASGAGLWLLAVATAAGYFVVMFGFPRLARLLPQQRRAATRLRISYSDRVGILRSILIACTSLRFAIDHVEIEREEPAGTARDEEEWRADDEGDEPERMRPRGEVILRIVVKGKRPVPHLIERLSGIDGVMAVATMDSDIERE